MMSCSTSGAPIPLRSRNSGIRVFLLRRPRRTRRARPPVRRRVPPQPRLPRWRHGRRRDRRPPIRNGSRAAHRPAGAAHHFEQWPPGTDDLDVARSRLLPGSAQTDAVLGGHVDVEGALTHHVVDYSGEDTFQLDASRGEQMGRCQPCAAPGLRGDGAGRPSRGR